MKKILNEFNASMDRIEKNFYLSFLVVNFINQRPFLTNIPIYEPSLDREISAHSLNSLDDDTLQEYGNSIRRHFLNDMLIVYERYSISMFASHNNNQQYTDYSKINNRKLHSSNFEQLENIYTPDDIEFLTQLRRLRNCIVHYNGKYSVTNELNYTFGTEKYFSRDNEGDDISINFNNLTWIFEKIKETVSNGNSNYNRFFNKTDIL
jgi:hypothetical protein